MILFVRLFNFCFYNSTYLLTNEEIIFKRAAPDDGVPFVYAKCTTWNCIESNHNTNPENNLPACIISLCAYTTVKQAVLPLWMIKFLRFACTSYVNTVNPLLYLAICTISIRRKRFFLYLYYISSWS